MAIWTLAKKDLRLLLRDARAMIILLAMPLIFITVLGVSLGEDFGKKDKLRISVVNLDKGLPPFVDRLAEAHKIEKFPPRSWSALVLKDLTESSHIEVELIETRAEAERLVKSGRRAAVLVLGPKFSKRVQRCSFLASGRHDESIIAASSYPHPGGPVELALCGLFSEDQDALPLYLMDGINPFYRDGVRIETLDVELLRDETQLISAAVVEQAAQGTFLRIILPWMIGRAFEKIGDPDFLTLMGQQEEMPFTVKLFLTTANDQQKKDLGKGLQNSIQKLFPRYKLTAKTWASLTKEAEHAGSGGDKMRNYAEDGQGWLKRGAARYQLVVPSCLVAFAFFLVLTVGWLFVAERRQGTLVRLRAAPLARWQILLGKLIPCYLISLFQGFFLLLAGRLIFNMSWGPEPLLLVPLVVCTSMAAMGLAMVVACLARTETQVAVYGTLLVIILVLVSGLLISDRSAIPEQLQDLTLCTPHAWALDGYRQLLAGSGVVDVEKIRNSCSVLALFGVGFMIFSWLMLKLE